MGNYRIFVEKKHDYQVEALSTMQDLNDNLGLKLKSLRILNIYDLFNIEQDLLIKTKLSVFSEVVTDDIYDEIELNNYIANEYLPGQFDQRADSAMQCISLIEPRSNVKVRSGKLMIFDEISKSDLDKIKDYTINRVEAREKDLSILKLSDNVDVKSVSIIKDFIKFSEEQIRKLKDHMSLAMTYDDLLHVQNYFKNELRNPTETEILVLDTYWSDHCRHTTFETIIKDVKFSSDRFNEQIKSTFNDYLVLRDKLNLKKPITLMDLATINTKYEKSNGNLDDLEISDEINACSIYVDVDVDGKLEKWLLMFKNETHNHPTEIEPFGGASTCVGGAIRDPLSGRSYVYQGVRVTGASDPTIDVKNTIKGKLPQKVICKKACEGFSSYGNQIGLATTLVREIYHLGFLAKRMEVGAVVGAAPVENVRREKPELGDVVIMLGGRTGRDGIGGATGSSKTHNEDSIETSSSEVQKGNAPEERKIQRLFRDPEAAKLIKKANDFGAGGISVAIGEIADSIEINLDMVKTKYAGLNATELAISESQERMAVLISYKDKNKFISLCQKENIEAYQVAEVTDNYRLVIKYKGKKIVDLSREFINTNGVRQSTNVIVNPVRDESPFIRNINGITLKEKLLNNLIDLNVSSQKGMIEHFDSTVGASTVLMPMGGKYQLTEAQSSVQKLPVLKGNTKTASIMTFGYNPYISSWSPYHGSIYAVLESLTKIAASGANYKNVRFSFQEYFEKMVDETSFGKPLASLLGAVHILKEFGLAAIGGKDSMSGTYKDINVPPTLISFAVTTENVDNIISNEFKEVGNYIYVIKHEMIDYMPNITELKDNFDFIYKNKNIISAHAIEFGGLSEGLFKMSLGNKIGFTVNTDINLFNLDYGSIIVESNQKLDHKNAILIGKVTNSISINDIKFDFNELIEALDRLTKVYPITKKSSFEISDLPRGDVKRNFKNHKFEKVYILIPVFPGMNSEYDMIKAFESAGGTVKEVVFRNQTKEDIINSIDELSLEIEKSNILAFSGGFSSGDEPDGSGKFIANVLKNKKISNSIEKLLENDGLILGICNGFQALVKSGLLPNGEENKDTSLFRNDINRHVSNIATTRVTTNNSPWLKDFIIGDIQKVPISHGEGKFVVSEKLAKELFKNDQVAFQYADFDGLPTMGDNNPNGSHYAIEGIVSKCGRILGKMGHSERSGEDLYKNIPGNLEQNIFKNAVNYFRGSK